MTLPRYSPRPFPPYAYLPGHNPHPSRDPQGHSYAPTSRVERAGSADQTAGSATADQTVGSATADRRNAADRRTVGSAIADRNVAGSTIAARTDRRRTWAPEDWSELEAWLYGVDLFNAGYFWEAHEAWESLWTAVERSSPPALFLQGLIQIAAAMLKVRQGVLAGARSLSTDGLDKLGRVAAVQTTMMGLHLPRAIAAFEDYFAPLAEGVLPGCDQRPILGLTED